MPNAPWRKFVLVACLVLCASSQPAFAHPLAETAHALSVKEEAHLHLVSGAETANGSLVEQGTAKGTLRGSIRAYLHVGATISATFTIYLAGGTVIGQGTGRLSGAAANPSFGGTMTVKGGTGKYRHARGHGGLYGVLNRATDNMTVQTTGTLFY